MTKKRILHVEDNAQNQRLVRKLLTAQGYELLEAEDGQAGVEMALAERPDLILMDINLPVLNGLEAIGRLKRSAVYAIPIVALTANAMKGDRERFLAAGADEYVQKPFTGNVLIAMVKKFIGDAEIDAPIKPAIAPTAPTPANSSSEAIAPVANPTVPPLSVTSLPADFPIAPVIGPPAAVPIPSVDQAASGTGMADVNDGHEIGG